MPRGAFAFKPIHWKRLDMAPVEREVYAQLEREGDVMRRMYESTTRTWGRRPRFWKVVGRGRGQAGVRVYTDDKIYSYVDYGTPRRKIRAKNKPYLVFRWPYKARTTPRVIGSHQRSVGNNYAKKKFVWHELKAREFTAEILKRRQPWFDKQMQAAIDRGLRRAQRG